LLALVLVLLIFSSVHAVDIRVHVVHPAVSPMMSGPH